MSPANPSLHRCGKVAIIGRPNVGKSTLLNRFLGEKIAIVSPKPETTRENLLGILTLPHAQILFVDTPGIYAGPKTLLGKFQIGKAREALLDAETILFMTEGNAGITEEDRRIVRLLPKKIPVFLAVNKADRVRKELILPQIDEARGLYPFWEIFPISARKGDNVEALLGAITQALPEGPALYPTDELTDRPLRDLAKELIREKVLLFTHEEIPHGVAVVIEEWRPGKPGLGGGPTILGGGPNRATPQSGAARSRTASYVYIRATVYVERESQKGILIGTQGNLLKRIGEASRREIETFTEGSVYLDLWVKVARNWRKDPLLLRRLGYGG